MAHRQRRMHETGGNDSSAIPIFIGQIEFISSDSAKFLASFTSRGTSEKSYIRNHNQQLSPYMERILEIVKSLGFSRISFRE